MGTTIPPTAVPLPTTHTTTLTGWQLWLARFVWLFITGLVLLTLSQLWPMNYWLTYSEWVVTLARPAVQPFIGYGNFVHLITLLESLTALTALVMGFIIAGYKSDDKMGLFVSAFLILSSPWFLSSNMDVWRLPVWVPLAGPLLSVLHTATLCSLVLFFYLFPDGRFVPHWTRWTAVLLIFLFVPFLISNLFNISSPFGDLWVVYTVAFVCLLIIAVAAQLYRYRTQTDPVQRQQMKWVIFGFAAYLVSILITTLGIFWESTLWVPLWELLIWQLAKWFIPLAIGFSILRYRLWEIDLLINRTLVYGLLTTLVIGLYILVVGLAGSLFTAADNALVAILATGVVAILFEPLRRRLQRSVNRFMYGEQDDPTAVLRQLGQRLAETAVPTEMLPNLVETIAKTLKLPYVAIVGNGGVEEQGGGGAEGILAVYASPDVPHTAPLAFPLVYQSETIGQLLVSPRAPGEWFNPVEKRLLEDIARQAGTAVYAARLTTDLQQARERLITTREEERRRLRRDLHDGLGPQLATVTIKVSAAQNLLKSDPDAAEKLLTEVKRESQNAIKEIRQVVEGLRPSALDQLGLLSALQEFVVQHTNGRTELSLSAPAELPALSAAAEVAVYRIATEAVTNCLHHAHAHHCTVQLAVNGYAPDGRLTLTIHDDGSGLPAVYQPGVGLASMRERAEELGGSFTIYSTTGGTVVTAVLPL